jgi:transposase, IS5 family
MHQLAFSTNAFDLTHRRTRKRVFLDEMEQVVPWEELIGLITPHAPMADKPQGGRPPIAVATMLRIHFMQQWFGLSDPAMEEALHDTPVLREFARIDLARDRLPDESTILRFRHLLEKHDIGKQIFERVNQHLSDKGLMLKEGSIVDATLIAAPPSTKNKAKARDPQMHQSKKGNQWHFGMKAHIGVDEASGLVHSVIGTAGNEADVTQANKLLHGQEKRAAGDAGYQGVDKRADAKPGVQWDISMKKGKRRELDKTTALGKLKDQFEKVKSQLRAKVEHPFRVLKCQFGYRKVRYKGLKKNTAQIKTLFALANLWMARGSLMQLQPQVRANAA